MVAMRTYTVVLVMIVLVGGVVGVTAELSTEHSVDITGSIDVPAQTIEVPDFGEATITEIGREEAGETLEVSTDVPENESYAIRILEIVDGDRRNLESEFVEGDVERSFFLDRYDSGTYVVALTQNGADTALEVEPFIVKGYTVDQSVSDVTKGEAITVDIQLTKVNNDASNPRVVNTTLFGNGTVRSIEAISTGENSYQANISTDDLPTDSYEIYTGIESNNDIYGYNELIGLSDSASVEVKEDSNPTSTPTPTPTPKPLTETSETANVSDGEATVTFPPGVDVSETQVNDLPEDVSRVNADVSATNPSSGTEGLPGDTDNNVVTFVDITSQDSTGNTEDVTQEITVSVTVQDTIVSGIADPTLYHDVNSNGSYAELDTQVSEVSNGTQLTATTTGLSPFAVAEATSTSTSTPTSTTTESPESTSEPDETSTSVGGGFNTEGSETATSAPGEMSTQTAQSSSTPMSNQSNEDEATGTGTQTQGQASESTIVETAPQPSETESESITTTNSEMPILPSGGIIVFLGILIGIVYRLQRSV
jgi:hypothetical protein